MSPAPSHGQVVAAGEAIADLGAGINEMSRDEFGDYVASAIVTAREAGL